jgi:glutamyl-tRNA reductase
MSQSLTLILVGVSHRTASVEIRGQIAAAKEMLAPALHASATSGAVRESVIVSTCNRLEVYAAAENPQAARAEIESLFHTTLQDFTEKILPCLYILEGEDVVRHIMRVAAGLDSIILGETQILGQLNTAYQEATLASATGWLLSRLFSQAIHTGKRAHTETGISRFPTSMSHAVMTTLKDRLGSLDGRKVLLIGAGKMVKLTAQILRRYGRVDLAFLNRTAERADALAVEYQGRGFSWDDLPCALAWADAAVAATGAHEPVVRAMDLALRLASPPPAPFVIVDLSVPRNVEAEVSLLPGVQLVGIDELGTVLYENIEKRKAAAPQLETIIANGTQAFLSWYRSRQISPVIAGLRRKIEEVAGSELDLAMRGMDHLGPDHQRIIQRLVHRVTNRLLHEPTVRLKAAGAAGQDYSSVVRHLFALDEMDVASL